MLCDSGKGCVVEVIILVLYLITSLWKKRRGLVEMVVRSNNS